MGTRVTSTSANEQYKPVKAIKSDIGWCSDYSQCSITQDEYIEIDFGAEVVVEAISILQAAGGYVTQYFVEYARSDRVFDCIREQFSNQIVSKDIAHYQILVHYILFRYLLETVFAVWKKKQGISPIQY